jgi:hypothetical protein
MEWRIDRLSVAAPSGECRFYLHDTSPQNLVAFAPNITNFDASDEASDIYVPGGSYLIAEFSSAGAGSICTAKAYGVINASL